MTALSIISGPHQPALRPSILFVRPLFDRSGQFIDDSLEIDEDSIARSFVDDDNAKSEEKEGNNGEPGRPSSTLENRRDPVRDE